MDAEFFARAIFSQIDFRIQFSIQALTLFQSRYFCLHA